MATPGFGLIAWASRLVPPARRGDWRREWEAETAYAWLVLQRNGRAGALQRLRLRARILTCVIDALWEKTETMTMTGLFNDMRFAARSLLRYPAFTAVAVLTLALGIGANTAVFTLVDGVLLRPLPFRDADQLLSMRHQGRDGADPLPMSSGLYLAYKERIRSLEGLGLYTRNAANLLVEGQPERILGQAGTPDFFTVLGVSAARGRTFAEDEGLPDGPSVVILSDGLWRSNFGADPDVVGKTVDMSGTVREVIGVMPPSFGYPDRSARFWVPLVIDPNRAPIASFFAGAVGRIAPGSSLEAVQAEIGGMLGQLDQLFPEDGGAGFLMSVGLKADIKPLKDDLVGDVRSTLWILLGTVGFVLLIACANVANLLLVRAEGRQRELALRVAVGAGRMDVLRAFMGESLVLATVGGALGLGVAALAVRVTSVMMPTDLPRMAEIAMDVRVFSFTAAVALGCALFFGFFPLVRYGADDLAGQLKDGGGARGSTGGPARHRLRNSLVVAQVALALVLLIGSGLMFRSFLALRAVDPGFDPDGVFTARIIVPNGEIQDDREAADFFRNLRERLAQQPGVQAVGFVSAVPLSEAGVSFGGMEVEDQPRAEDELPVFASLPQADVGYVEAMGIDLLEGRTFQRGDGGDDGRGALVSKAFAEHWWPDSSPLGRRVRFGAPNEEWYTIVGVVGDVHQNSLQDSQEEGAVYFPTLGEVDGNFFAARAQDVVMRVTGDPLSYLQVLRREVQALNPRIPVASPRTMDDIFDASTARTSFTMAMLGAASGIALLLGLVGIYGVISYVVSQRSREIGVRMALGASAPSVRGMVVRQGLALAGAGVLVGLVAALGLSRIMGAILFGVSATDPLTYGAVSVTLVGVATLASWIPARRASRVDPSTALRAE
jgi:predicted permease